MGIKLFAGRERKGERLFLPVGYRKSVKWLPQIGDIFPDFEAATTEGELRFFDWAEGHWSFLFSHPAAFTPICTTEMVSLVAAKADFERCNVRLLGFTASSLDDQIGWHDDIHRNFGACVDFPTVEDTNGALSRAFGMMHAKESTIWPIRKSFILDPSMRIRMIFEYPMQVGRSTDEVVRAVQALQASDRHGVAIPADWTPGEDFLCPIDEGRSNYIKRHPDRIKQLTSYLSLVSPPAGSTGTGDPAFP